MTSSSSRRPIGTGPWLRAARDAGVAGEVLEGGDDAGALQAADVGGAEHRHQVRVLAHRLLDAAPAVVADDVQHRREALVHADRGHVPADRGGHPLDEVGVEGGAPGDRRGVDGGAVGREAGEALLVDERRDPQPRALEDDALLPHQLRRAVLRGHRGAAEHAREVAEAVPARLLQRHLARRLEDVLQGRDVVRGAVPDVGAEVRRAGPSWMLPATQRLPSCATFSSRVSSARSSSTRSATGSAGSRHRCVATGRIRDRVGCRHEAPLRA